MRTSLLIGLISGTALAADTHPMTQADTHPMTQIDIAKMLGWKADKLAICEGHFLIDPQSARIANPPPLNKARTSITTRDRSTFSQKGTSVLRGDVEVRQPGRLLKADTVRIIRNPRTQKISVIEMRGDVSLEERDRKLAAAQARVNLQNNTMSAINGAFRTKHETPLAILQAWGSAHRADRDPNGNLIFHHATYSVCPIKNPAWRIKASTLYLNNQKGYGTATNARFLLWGMPVMYLPYLAFPITGKRKSGFLMPGPSYDEDDGFSLEAPYYFNLAPNYDDLMSAKYSVKRGIKVSNHFRYLTASNIGSFYLSVLPDDQRFRSFQRDSKNKYRNQPSFTPFLSRIENASPTRYSGSFKHISTFNEHWGGSIDAHYVSDDYYLHDFGSDPITSNTVNLFNQAQVHYQDDHWEVLARAMGYQTLHPIGNISIEPYNRVPQLAATADYPDSLLHLDYAFWFDYTNFDHRNNFYTDVPVVSGHRLHILPAIGFNWRRPYAFFHPMLRTDITNYWLRNEQYSDNIRLKLNGQENARISRVIPIGSVDTGLIFERHSTYFRQTLEPRIYYLIVPRQNQDDIPLFDTTLPRFNFEQLFYYNRFTGYDRLGDANEITLALSSHFYDNATGVERFSASAGVMYQFSKRSVCLTDNCNEERFEDFVGDDKWSPILFNANYHLTPATYAQVDWSLDPNNGGTHSGDLRLHYEPAPNHILHAGYDFVRDGDRTIESSNINLSRIDLGLAWPLGVRWNVLANWNYNLSHSHNQHYLVGLGYDSCCFAVRGIISRTALTLNLDDNAKFDTKYYLEIKLKGLGTLGSANPSQLLDTSIVGYQDLFRR